MCSDWAPCKKNVTFLGRIYWKAEFVSKSSKLTASPFVSAPGHSKDTNSWQRLCTTNWQTEKQTCGYVTASTKRIATEWLRFTATVESLCCRGKRHRFTHAMQVSKITAWGKRPTTRAKRLVTFLAKPPKQLNTSQAHQGKHNLATGE